MTTKRTPEQQAAIDRAKKPKTHPYRVHHGAGFGRQSDTQKIVPYSGRLVRR